MGDVRSFPVRIYVRHIWVFRRNNLLFQARNMTSDLQIIKEACIAANPEIEIGRSWTSPPGETASSIIENLQIRYRPIFLSDVLLAWHKDFRGTAQRECLLVHDIFCNWNLKEYELTKQSEETLSFLASLLTSEKK